MARLPTVVLKRKTDGAVRIMDATAYARDLHKNASTYVLISTTHGDATDAEVAYAAQQAEVEFIRAANPNTLAHGDAQRAYEARAIVTTLDTARPSEPVEAEVEEVVTESVADMSDNSLESDVVTTGTFPSEGAPGIPDLTVVEAEVETAVDEAVEKIGKTVAAARRGRPTGRKVK